MKKFIAISSAVLLFSTLSFQLFSQSDPVKQDFGIAVGGFTNFPADQNYLTDLKSALFVAPYVQVGRHEFSAGIVFPFQTNALYYTGNKTNPNIGGVASYKFYVFNVYYRENLFIHYSFQYLAYKGSYDVYYGSGTQPYHWDESDMYINNIIGLGYNIYFDNEERFGFYYTLDYVISQTGYKLSSAGYHTNSWSTNFVWNNFSTQVGFTFKITPLKKKVKK
ncbi:MAG: hypothetical protein NTU51_04255 [Bacteroidetes bacterium]|nr:hypothetical protein [Bacteroidota bacterium]